MYYFLVFPTHVVLGCIFGTYVFKKDQPVVQHTHILSAAVFTSFINNVLIFTFTYLLWHYLGGRRPRIKSETPLLFWAPNPSSVPQSLVYRLALAIYQEPSKVFRTFIKIYKNSLQHGKSNNLLKFKNWRLCFTYREFSNVGVQTHALWLLHFLLHWSISLLLDIIVD